MKIDVTDMDSQMISWFTKMLKKEKEEALCIADTEHIFAESEDNKEKIDYHDDMERRYRAYAIILDSYILKLKGDE